MQSEEDRKALEDRVRRELADSIDEDLELELGDEMLARLPEHGDGDLPQSEGIDRKFYFTELLRLQRELIKLQDWVVARKLKVVVLFEGRDAAGAGCVAPSSARRAAPRRPKLPRIARVRPRVPVPAPGSRMTAELGAAPPTNTRAMNAATAGWVKNCPRSRRSASSESARRTFACSIASPNHRCASTDSLLTTDWAAV